MNTSSPSIVDQLLAAVVNCLDRESARRLSELRLDSGTEAHLNELAQKQNEGALSDDELAAYRDCVEVMDLVAILQHKAASSANAKPR